MIESVSAELFFAITRRLSLMYSFNSNRRKYISGDEKRCEFLIYGNEPVILLKNESAVA